MIVGSNYLLKSLEELVKYTGIDPNDCYTKKTPTPKKTAENCGAVFKRYTNSKIK